MAKTKAKPVAEGQIRLEHVRMSLIKPAPRNPKEHDAAGIAAAISRFGFITPIVEDARSGLVAAGHGRKEAAELLFRKTPKKPPRFVTVADDGEWMLPVLKGVAFDSEAEAEAYLVGVNRWVEVGGWDSEMLVPMLEQLVAAKDDTALKAIGMTRSWIAGYLADFDADASVRGRTPGQLAEGYNAGAVKQIVVYFPGEEAEQILVRLSRVMRREKVDSNSAALERLLTSFESRRKLKPIRVAA